MTVSPVGHGCLDSHLDQPWTSAALKYGLYLYLFSHFVFYFCCLQVFGTFFLVLPPHTLPSSAVLSKTLMEIFFGASLPPNLDLASSEQ